MSEEGHRGKARQAIKARKGRAGGCKQKTEEMLEVSLRARVLYFPVDRGGVFWYFILTSASRNTVKVRGGPAAVTPPFSFFRKREPFWDELVTVPIHRDGKATKRAGKPEDLLKYARGRG